MWQPPRLVGCFFARLVPVFPADPVNRRSFLRSLRRLMRGDYFLSHTGLCVWESTCVFTEQNLLLFTILKKRSPTPFSTFFLKSSGVAPGMSVIALKRLNSCWTDDKSEPAGVKDKQSRNIGFLYLKVKIPLCLPILLNETAVNYK